VQVLSCPRLGFVYITPPSILPTNCGYLIKPLSTTASARDSILLLQEETPRSRGGESSRQGSINPSSIHPVNLVSPPNASASLSWLSLIGVLPFLSNTERLNQFRSVVRDAAAFQKLPIHPPMFPLFTARARPRLHPMPPFGPLTVPCRLVILPFDWAGQIVDQMYHNTAGDVKDREGFNSRRCCTRMNTGLGRRTDG